MIFKPQWKVRKSNEYEGTTSLSIQYTKQTELMNSISKQLEEVLNPYENREDIKISIMLNDAEHFIDKPDGCSITCKVVIEPKKEVIVKEK